MCHQMRHGRQVSYICDVQVPLIVSFVGMKIEECRANLTHAFTLGRNRYQHGDVSSVVITSLSLSRGCVCRGTTNLDKAHHMAVRRRWRDALRLGAVHAGLPLVARVLEQLGALLQVALLLRQVGLGHRQLVPRRVGEQGGAAVLVSPE